MGGRERLVATPSALIFSIVGNLCQLYSGKPVSYDLSSRHALTAEELGLHVAGQLRAFVGNLTCPADHQPVAASCAACDAVHWESVLIAAVSALCSFVAGFFARRRLVLLPSQQATPAEPTLGEEPSPTRRAGKRKQGGPASHLAVDASRW